MSSTRNERLFVIRMWREPSAARDAWRGSIQDVASGRTLYVTGPADIVDFIALRLVEPNGPAERA